VRHELLPDLPQHARGRAEVDVDHLLDMITQFSAVHQSRSGVVVGPAATVPRHPAVFNQVSDERQVAPGLTRHLRMCNDYPLDRV
jgi:hypothetical protein